MTERKILVSAPTASTGGDRFDRDYYDSYVAFMPDGGFSVIATYDEIIWEWDKVNLEWTYDEGPQRTILQSFTKDGKKLGPEEILQNTTRGIAYDSDNDRILSTADYRGILVKYFDAQTSTEKNIVVAAPEDGRNYFSSQVAFKADGSFSVLYTYEDESLGKDVSILQHYTESGNKSGSGQTLLSRTTGLAYDTDGDRLLSTVSYSGVTVKYFDFQTSTESEITVAKPGKDYYKTQVAFMPNGDFSVIYTYEDDESDHDVSVLQNYSEDGRKLGTEQLLPNMSQGISHGAEGHRLISTANGGEVSVLYTASVLFTTEADSVNFNSLTSDQKKSIGDGVDIYSALSGNDIVVLPGTATIIGTAATWSARQTFSAGAGNDLVRGGALADLIRGNANDDRLYGNGSHDKLWGDNGLDRLWGGVGNDSLFAGNGDDFLFGGDGNDQLWGESGNDSLSGGVGIDRLTGAKGRDTLNGGIGNDSLIGGADVDTFVFATKFENTWARFNQARSLGLTTETGIKVTNRDGDGQVVLSSKSEGLDLVQDGEVAQFQNGKQDLSAIKFVINRTSDGHATGKVFENGIEVTKLTNGIDGPARGLHQPLGDILWDTLTPIGTGSYSGHYRSDGRLGERIELSGWTKGQGLLSHDGVERTKIQIHSGQNNGNSEGCFIVNRDFRKVFFDHVRESVGGNGDLVYEGGYFFPVVPVVIQVRGEVNQTKIHGIDDVVTRPRPGDGPAAATVGFDVMDVFGSKKLDHYRKSIDVFFTASADGKDWKLPAKLIGSEPSAGGSSHGQIWREDTDGGTAVYGIRIGVSGETMRSHVTFDLPIGAGSPSKIDFKIVDLDLWTKSSKGWGLYSVSKDKNDTDGANGAEGLLLLGLDKKELTSSVTVKTPKLPALVAEPDDATVFASASTFEDHFLF